MDFTLEVIPLPVSDIDRARDFYRDKVGFHVDIDQEVMPGMRIVQLTPPGSGCSIALGDSIWDLTKGETVPEAEAELAGEPPAPDEGQAPVNEPEPGVLTDPLL